MSKDKNNYEMILSGDFTALETIAKGITEVSDAFIKINEGPLTRRAIVLLIKDTSSTPLNHTQINAVLDAAAGLKDQFVRQEQ